MLKIQSKESCSGVQSQRGTYNIRYLDTGSRCNDRWNILVELLQEPINGRGSVTEGFETSKDLYMMVAAWRHCNCTVKEPDSHW